MSYKSESISRIKVYRHGMRDGIPIALGYFAVAFTLGIAARNAGMNAWQGFLASALCTASAGEYAGFVVIAAGAPYLEMVIVTLVTNARYLLMSCALGQRFAPEMSMRHRLLMGFTITDELFGIAIARPGMVNPWYSYGAVSLTLPAWAIGTACGVLAGNALPGRVVSALSVALYGMFIAIIVPPAKKNRVVAVLVAVSFAASFLLRKLPLFAEMTDGSITILLTVVIAAVAAVFFPVADESDGVAEESVEERIDSK